MTDAPRTGRLARLVDSDRFASAIAVVIVVNAVILGLETYPAIMAEYGDLLALLNGICFGVFVVELVLRIASYGRNIGAFFRNGWNVFDLIVIGAVFIPGVREEAQLLRLLRLARIVRLVRYLPDARILLLTVIKSIPSLFSMVVLTVLLLFIYGMVGWSMFGEALPQSWGTISRSMLTLFILLTLENFPTYLEQAEPISPYAVVFFVSYVLIAAFVVFNLLIGIVIGAMERAREGEDAAAADATKSVSDSPADDTDVLARIRDLKRDLAALEDAVTARTASAPRAPGNVSPR
jgi:voltage-gated sodium channel